MKLTGYEKTSLRRIKRWEGEGHSGLHKKILDAASRPVDYVLKRIGRERLRFLENAITRTVRQLLYASTYTVDPAELIRRAHAHGMKIQELTELKRCDLEKLDDCNRSHISFHEKAGAIQGAAAGLGGAATAAADLTALLVQDFHMIQEIAFCYAYDPNDLVEKEIILKIIEIGIGSSQVKARAIAEIELLKRASGSARKAGARKQAVSVLGSKALEEYIEHLTAALVVRLVPRAVPIVSMVVSAHSNHEIIEHSGNAAFMVYGKRFILRKRSLRPLRRRSAHRSGAAVADGQH